MQRREFITLLGSAVASWPLAASAQPGDGIRRIAVLLANYSQSDREGQASIAAFLDTFQRLGWTNGRNVWIEYRWGAGDVERIKASAAELVHSAPNVIVVVSNLGVAELQRLTSTIPIVFAQVGDPVGSGFVAGLARPGGNITGFQNYDLALVGKWLALLKEASPNVSRVAMLFGSNTATNIGSLREAEAVAPSLGMTVTAINVLDDGGIEREVATFASQPDGGLIVVPHANTVANRASIIILAARYRLVAIYPFRFFAAEGGLMSYGPDQIDQ
jgi:putative ABC transport system substrate-binding protein